MLGPRPAPQGFRFADQPPGAPPKAEVWHWLSLDPTPPGEEGADATTVGAWLDDARATWATFFMDFIVGYNPARRQRAVDAATGWLERWWWAVLAVPFAGAVFFASRSAVRRWGHAVGLGGNGVGSGFPWFDSLTRVLRDHGLTPPAGATPREAATAAYENLIASGHTVDVADVRFHPGEDDVRPLPRPQVGEEAGGAAATERRLGRPVGGEPAGELRGGRAEALRVLLGRHDRHPEQVRGVDQKRDISYQFRSSRHLRQQLVLHVDHDEDAVGRGQARDGGHRGSLFV